jgi:hypothetical protein
MMETKAMNRSLGMMMRTAAGILAITMATQAEFPLGSMGPRDLGIQYGFAFRGQDITAQDVASHETIHALTLGYSPIPYLGLEAGMGLDRFEVERYRSASFKGDFGLAPLIGLVLATPYALDFARLTGGIRAMMLNSEDGDGYSYSGLILNPWVSAIITPTAYFDFQIGVRGHSIDGTMASPGAGERPFSNRNIFRGFGSLTVKSPSEKAFLTLDIDVSPELDGEWSEGPREASIGVSFGTMLGWSAGNPKSESSPPYFPAYGEMKDKQDQMAEETK